MAGEKACIVYNYSRSSKKTCLVPSLRELKFTGRGLLKMDFPLEGIRIVLEECGAEVLDEDVFEELPSLTGFMLLIKGQKWINRLPVEINFSVENFRQVSGANEILRQLHQQNIYGLLAKFSVDLLDEDVLQTILMAQPENVPDLPPNTFLQMKKRAVRNYEMYLEFREMEEPEAEPPNEGERSP